MKKQRQFQTVARYNQADLLQKIVAGRGLEQYRLKWYYPNILIEMNPRAKSNSDNPSLPYYVVLKVDETATVGLVEIYPFFVGSKMHRSTIDSGSIPDQEEREILYRYGNRSKEEKFRELPVYIFCSLVNTSILGREL